MKLYATAPVLRRGPVSPGLRFLGEVCPQTGRRRVDIDARGVAGGRATGQADADPGLRTSRPPIT